MSTKARIILRIQGSGSLSESDFVQFMTSQPLARILYPLFGEDMSGNSFWIMSPEELTTDKCPIFSQEPSKVTPLQYGNYGMHCFSSDSARITLQLISSNKINFLLRIDELKPLTSAKIDFYSVLKHIVEILNPVQTTIGYRCPGITDNEYSPSVGQVKLEGYGFVRVFVDLITYFSPLMVKAIGKDKFNIVSQSSVSVKDYQDGIVTEIINPLEPTDDFCKMIYFQKIYALKQILNLDTFIEN